MCMYCERLNDTPILLLLNSFNREKKIFAPFFYVIPNALLFGLFFKSCNHYTEKGKVKSHENMICLSSLALFCLFVCVFFLLLLVSICSGDPFFFFRFFFFVCVDLHKMSSAVVVVTMSFTLLYFRVFFLFLIFLF